MSTVRTVVLLSTYQGEKHITDQLRSIVKQLNPNDRVIIRDDGSTDKTLQKIHLINDERISVIEGINIGFVRSFFCLLNIAPDDFDMFMLCDQDDVWLPNKISRAASHLRQEKVPTLYCSGLTLTDEDLRVIGSSPRYSRGPSFKNALTENIVTGCTCAINRVGLSLARRHGNLDLIYFHDWWLYLTFSAVGNVVLDAESSILYRQHSNNAIGMGSGITRYIKIFNFLKKQNWVKIMYSQIFNLQATYNSQELGKIKNDLLQIKFQSTFKSKTSLIFSLSRFRQTLLSELLFRMLLLFNLFR